MTRGVTKVVPVSAAGPLRALVMTGKSGASGKSGTSGGAAVPAVLPPLNPEDKDYLLGHSDYDAAQIKAWHK